MRTAPVRHKHTGAYLGVCALSLTAALTLDARWALSILAAGVLVVLASMARSASILELPPGLEAPSPAILAAFDQIGAAAGCRRVQVGVDPALLALLGTPSHGPDSDELLEPFDQDDPDSTPSARAVRVAYRVGLGKDRALVATISPGATHLGESGMVAVARTLADGLGWPRFRELITDAWVLISFVAAMWLIHSMSASILAALGLAGLYLLVRPLVHRRAVLAADKRALGMLTPAGRLQLIADMFDLARAEPRASMLSQLTQLSPAPMLRAERLALHIYNS